MTTPTSESGLRGLAGMADLLPEESRRWVAAEEVVRAVMRRFGFGEIRCPILEPTELFERGTGATTDIVQKEMYTFTDRGDRSVTLRPEGTPSVVRVFLEQSLGVKRPTWKFYYIGPMFRAERPQQGRQRQFHQFGAELIGSEGPSADIELIALADAVLRELAVAGFRLVLNSIGSRQARIDYNAALREFLTAPDVFPNLCADCKRRTQTNPLRVFDCKQEACQRIINSVPTIDQYLTSDDRAHFAAVCAGLDRLGIAYEIDLRLVRGLDYYTRTTFELKTDRLGAQDALLGGGRYDNLVEALGGPPTPAVGFAAGMERILSVTEPPSLSSEDDRLDVFVSALGDKAAEIAPAILSRLRQLGLAADRDFLRRGLKAQMKEADRLRARFALIVGDDEIARGHYILRVMDTSEQRQFSADMSTWTAGLFT